MTGIAVGTVHLEENVALHLARNASIGGAPRGWVEEGQLLVPPSTEPSSFNGVGIPFDKCDGVVEYDARLGTLPDAQGFARAGAGSASKWTMSPNGVLQYAGTQENRWTKTLTLGSSADRIYSGGRYYADDKVLQQQNPSAELEFFATYRITGLASVPGVRAKHKATLSQQGPALGLTLVDLFGGFNSDLAMSPPSFNSWHVFALANSLQQDSQAWYDAAGRASNYLWQGTDSVVSPDDTMTLGFGQPSGVAGQLTAYIQHVWASTPGRFLRARMESFTQVASPVLRLYLVSDLDAAETLARFKITYGSDPYLRVGNTASATVSFTAKHQVFELPITLPGLTADQPFWFTVERDWTHADDRTRATVWMNYATVRSA